MNVRWKLGALASLFVGLYLAMSEINRLTGDVLDGQGRSWPLTDLMGPSRLFDMSSDGWTAIGFSDLRLTGWFHAYLILDFVYIGVYGFALNSWLGPRLIVWLLIGFDVAENLLAFAAGRGPQHPGWVQGILPWVSALKWAAVLLLAVAIARLLVDPVNGAAWRAQLRRVRRALYIHRFSLIPLVPLTLLALGSGPNLLDQLPDIQRQWRDNWTGGGHALAAVFAICVLSCGLLALGRMRSDFAHIRANESAAENDDRPLPDLRIYVIGPVVVTLGALAVLAAGGEGLVWKRYGIFVGVPLVILLLSVVIRNWFTVQRPARRGLDPDDVPVITAVGDILAILPVAIGGLALIRSFTAVAALLARPRESASSGAGWVWLALLAGLGTATLGWWIAVRAIRLVSEQSALAPQLTVGITDTFSPATRWLVLLVCLVVFIFVGVFPLIAAALGVIACAVLTLGSLALLVGSIVVIAQDGGAPEVLWPLRLRSAPVAVLLIASLVWAGKVGDDHAVHGVRNLPEGTASAERVDVATAFKSWLDQTESVCQTDMGAFALRPMFLVAAEGGGIRAAYWTAAGLDNLVREAPCAANVTLLSGGASGGAVGLTVARFAQPGASREEVQRMADPMALASGAIGLFARDLSYAATGVPLPARGNGAVEAKLQATGNDGWADRAALFESVWQTQSSALDQSFVPNPDSAPGHPSGSLVLSSTSVGTGCRYLVSQLRLAPKQTPTTDCADVRQPVAGTLDLLDAYGGPRANDEDHCVGPLVAATAAMLASRFPFVTPSGVVGPCGSNRLTDQLVDGGYVENTGLGTLVDLANQWMPLVQAHNTAQLRSTAKPALVVPVVIYMDNGTGSDLRPPTIKVTDEVLVPSAPSLN